MLSCASITQQPLARSCFISLEVLPLRVREGPRTICVTVLMNHRAVRTATPHTSLRTIFR